MTRSRLTGWAMAGFMATALSGLAIGCAQARPPATQPTDAAANPDTARPTEVHAASAEPTPAGPLSADASLDQILDALDRRGRDLTTLSADVRHTDTATDLGVATTRSGVFRLANKAEGETSARILFTRTESDGRPREERIEYALDGGRLTERNYQRKKEVVRHILRPGEKVNLLKLGEGPFPLPIGQKREDVYASFTVEKIATAAGDPPETVHVRLTPKRDTALARKFKTIDVWVDLATEMPRRITTLDRNEANEVTTELTNLKVNQPISPAELALEPVGEGWDRHEEAFEGR